METVLTQMEREVLAQAERAEQQAKVKEYIGSHNTRIQAENDYKNDLFARMSTNPFTQPTNYY